jgi:prefoldin subunit 5
MLNEQMRMIDEKIEKFQSFKKRLEAMQAKAENALQSID